MKNLTKLIELIGSIRTINGSATDSTLEFLSMELNSLHEADTPIQKLSQSQQNHLDACLEPMATELLGVIVQLCQTLEEQELRALYSLCTLPDKDSRTDAPERKEKTLLEKMVPDTPALLAAHLHGKNAATVGFDWPTHQGVFDKISEEMAELQEAIQNGKQSHIQHEYGDLLLASASLGRHLQLCPEHTLSTANYRFQQRFQHMEEAANQQLTPLQELTPAALEELWRMAKQNEKTGS